MASPANTATREPIELSRVGDARTLLEELESALAGDINAAQLQRILTQSKDQFLELLKFQPQSPQFSRPIVDSGSINTTQGLITLDRVPDIQEILLLADEFKVDELLALSLVLAAQQQSGIVSAAAAAGVFYDERMHAVQSLLTLLHTQVAFAVDDVPTDIYATIATFNASLLQTESNQKTLLLHRLADLIQSGSVLPNPTESRFSTVLDSYGRVLDRADIVQRECTALCQCLLYACCIKQRMTALDVERLLDLLHHLSLHLRTPGFHQLAAQHQANLVLLCVLLTLMPLEDAQGSALSADDSALRALAQEQTLHSKISTLSGSGGGGTTPTPSTAAAANNGTDGYASVVRLAWGIVPLCCDDQDLTKRGLGDVHVALQGGAIGFLGSAIMNSVQMRDEDEDVRLTAASVIHQLLDLYIQVAPEGLEAMKRETMENAAKELQAPMTTGANNATTTKMGGAQDGGDAMAVDASRLHQQLMVAPSPSAGGAPHHHHNHHSTFPFQQQTLLSQQLTIEKDTLSSLLYSLARVYTARPGLFLDEDRRSLHVAQLMTSVGSDPQLRNVPSIFLSYVVVLTALATTEIGARIVFAQLCGDNAPALIGWRRMFATLHAVINTYNTDTMPAHGPSAGAPTSADQSGNSGGGGGSAGKKKGVSDIVLPETDTKALVAFARLFETIMSQGNADEVASWVRQLDEEAGISPSWEVLFQVMCCPVPQSLKAALDAAIGSIARRPDLATALWDRLLASVVVQPFMVTTSLESATVPRYDLAYQLNEIESRSEDYQEAVAFVKLLNVLWRASGGALPDDGRPVAHFTRFVREELLATVFQRAFIDEAQRWELVATGLEHCRLCLESINGMSPSSLAAELSQQQQQAQQNHGGNTNGNTGNGMMLAKPPGVDVLLDLLNEKSAARAALTTLSFGVDVLASERHSTLYGSAKEAACLAALRLLHAVFQHDADFVAAVRRALLQAHHRPSHVGGVGYETFESVLRHDRSRIPIVLEYVRYPFNSKIQEETVKITASIAQRIPGLVQLLLTVNSSSSGSNGEPSISQRLQDSFAVCLHDAVAEMNHPSTPAGGSVGGGGRSSGSSGSQETTPVGTETDLSVADQRGELILELLLSTLQSVPTPNLSQLLCGFWVSGGTTPLLFQEIGIAMHTPLRVILDVLSIPRNAIVRPRVFELCLQFVHELADAADTAPATLDVLRSYVAPVLVPLLDTVGCAPLPSVSLKGGSVVASSLYQRTWLLQLCALVLRRGDPAVLSERDALFSILMALFNGTTISSSNSTATTSAEQQQQRGKCIDILAIAVASLPAEPQLLSSTSNAQEVRRMMQTLDIEALLNDTSAISMQGARGAPLFDVALLKDELLHRLSEWVARHGAPGEALKEAGRGALAYAAAFNDYAEEMNGRMALLEAWQAVVSVAFTDSFDLLATLRPSTSSSTDLIITVLEHTLQAASMLLSSPAAGLAPPLTGSIQALFARFQDQALAAATADPLAGLPLPARCHMLFAALLNVGWEGRSQETVRMDVYSAVMSYLAMSKGPSLLAGPSNVVYALLQGIQRSLGGGGGGGGGMGPSADIDAITLQLEEGNVAVLHSNTRFLPILAQDAVSPNPTLCTAALTTLASLVATDPTTTLSDDLHRIALPSRLLQDLRDQAPETLIQPPPLGQAATLVMESKFAMLVRLALAGPPTHRASSAQKLFALQAIQSLSACKCIDLQPEEPGFGSASTAATTTDSLMSLRHSLFQIISPALRLVLTLITALPHSGPVREQTTVFVSTHARAFARILREAASAGVRGWEPGDGEIEQATLVVQLLCELAQHRVDAPVPVVVQEAAYRCASRFLAGNAKSQSPPVIRVAAAREAGTAGPSEQKTYLKILGLRLALASYLQLLSSPSGAQDNGHPPPTLFPCVSEAGSAGGDLAAVSPTLFLFKDALLQAAVHDLPDAVADRDVCLNALRQQQQQQKMQMEERTSMVRAATTYQKEVGLLGALIEHLLAILFQHLKVAAVVNSGGGIDGTAQRLGSAKDLDQLRRLTEPAIVALERMLSEGVLPGDASSFELLIRRTKECFVYVC